MEEATSLAAGIRAWMLLSKEGLPIASAVPQGLEEAEIAAMAASILGVADLAAERMDQGLLEEVLITNEGGFMIMKSAGEKATLGRRRHVGIQHHEIGIGSAKRGQSLAICYSH